MRDPSHMQQIEKWAEYVRDNPRTWKSKLKPFIDSQIMIAKRFYENLTKTEEGKEVLKQLRLDKINRK